MSSPRLPGTPRLLRAINDRSALELLLERGPLTRAQLGELTGLSKVTASQLVERLEERGLVARVGEQAGGRGPNAQLYAVVPASAFVVGVEIGPEHATAAGAAAGPAGGGRGGGRVWGGGGGGGGGAGGAGGGGGRGGGGGAGRGKADPGGGRAPQPPGPPPAGPRVASRNSPSATRS